MKIQINNKEVETQASQLQELAAELGLPEKGIALAVDNKMIPRVQWAQCPLSEGAHILMIKAACGG